MLNQSGIYIIKSIANQKYYIGSAKNLKQRFDEHTRRLKRDDHENAHLQRSWNKYTISKFEFAILEICEPYLLLEREQKYIDYYKEKCGWRNLFNMNPSASSRLGSPVTAATRLKMSLNNTRHFLGKKHTKETRRKISKANMGNKSSLGRILSDETKAKIGEANSGRIVTEETRRKISVVGKGRVVSGETKEKLKRSPRFKGHKHTDEAKDKIRKALKNKTFSKETRKKISDGVKRAWNNRVQNRYGEGAK